MFRNYSWAAILQLSKVDSKSSLCWTPCSSFSTLVTTKYWQLTIDFLITGTQPGEKVHRSLHDWRPAQKSERRLIDRIVRCKWSETATFSRKTSARACCRNKSRTRRSPSYVFPLRFDRLTACRTAGVMRPSSCELAAPLTLDSRSDYLTSASP